MYGSAPVLSSRTKVKASAAASMDDVSSRSSWKSLTNEELAGKIDVDDNSSLGMAAPLLKSFMQVKFQFYILVSLDFVLLNMETSQKKGNK